MSCIRGAIVEGNLEMEITTILKEYAKCWLPLDIFLLAADWSTWAQSLNQSKIKDSGDEDTFVKLVPLVLSRVPGDAERKGP